MEVYLYFTLYLFLYRTRVQCHARLTNWRSSTTRAKDGDTDVNIPVHTTIMQNNENAVLE